MKDHLLQTLPVWWFYFSSTFFIAMIAGFIWKSEGYRMRWQEAEVDLTESDEDLTRALDLADEADERAARADERVAKADTISAEVVMAVAPLMEKTDWMTGRYGGQFGRLVQLENERNRTVEEVMRRVSALPAVQDLPKVAILDGAQQEALGRLETEVGVPEGQGLSFRAEGGVERVYKHLVPMDWPK